MKSVHGCMFRQQISVTVEYKKSYLGQTSALTEAVIMLTIAKGMC
jgi:hypothetical protein